MEDLGAVLASIGMTVNPDDDERIVEAILITKQINMSTGDQAVGTYWTDGLRKDWISRDGMMVSGVELISAATEAGE